MADWDEMSPRPTAPEAICKAAYRAVREREPQPKGV